MYIFQVINMTPDPRYSIDPKKNAQSITLVWSKTLWETQINLDSLIANFSKEFELKLHRVLLSRSILLKQRPSLNRQHRTARKHITWNEYFRS